jgi:predicted negative regulator of RcsB-dependent stress response
MNEERVAAAEAELDRLAAQARKINRAILVIVLLIVALLVGWNWPL